jgi:DNA-binding CsgD family transcriptional regulator
MTMGRSISNDSLLEKPRRHKPEEKSFFVQGTRPYYDIYELLQENAFSYFLSIDCSKKQFMFISRSIKNVLGYSHDFYLKAGLSFALESIHPDDLRKLSFLQKRILRVFHDYPVEKRKLLKFDSNFRVKRADGKYVQILRQTIFPELTEDGEASFDFSTCTDISRYKQDNNMKLTIYLREGDNFRQLQEFDISASENVLTKRQSQIIELIAQGMTSNQIAHKLVISAETVKNHRKKILENTGAKNIAEAMKITFGNQNVF